MDREEERERLLKELAEAEGELEALTKKLRAESPQFRRLEEVKAVLELIADLERREN
jgi:hypothetical protein